VSWAEWGPIRLWWEDFGDADAPVMLLICGLGNQCISWPGAWCDAIAAEGFRVVRFDNRDVGRSTHLDHIVPDVPAVIAAKAAGLVPDVPYTLGDMAADAVAVLDAAGAARAHVVGVSMGAQIAQMVAIGHGGRVASLASMCSRTGDPDVGQPSPEARKIEALAPPRTPQEHIDRAVACLEVWGSPAFFDRERIVASAAAAAERCFDPAGRERQRMAIIAASSRTEALGGVRAPTLVVHGLADRLIDPSGGRRTASAVPGARLELIEGMGHDYPPELWPQLTALLVRNARRADGAALS
jgi:pimeloyl-ACP methyl ester carboxylesterase